MNETLTDQNKTNLIAKGKFRSTISVFSHPTEATMKSTIETAKNTQV